jgi:hypothetical protein
MITDSKITAYKGIAGHFKSDDGKTIIILAEDVKSLALAAAKFIDGADLKKDRCNRAIIIAEEVLA